jgi:trehalose 6-phosphate synthase/phosphatase
MRASAASQRIAIAAIARRALDTRPSRLHSGDGIRIDGPTFRITARHGTPSIATKLKLEEVFMTRVPTPPMPAVERGDSSSVPAPASRLLIVSNRLPMTVRHERGRVTIERSSGGLATGMRSPHERSQGWWIGWPGDIGAIDGTAREEMMRQFTENRVIPVSLSASAVKVFYEELSNGVLWPLCHDRLDRLPLNISGWDVYEEVNSRFADAVAKVWRPGDVIWIHDYHLMRVPALLRARLPKARIGFFLHVPFPNPEVFLALPVRRWLVEGLLGADLIGFHTRRYRGHFTAVLRRLFGIEMDADAHVRHGGRAIQLGVFPMGVDAHSFAERAASREVSSRVLDLKTHHRLLVGIDRLDYSKGIARRLAAFERFLIDRPEWRERVRLIQVAVPSRGSVDAYRKFRTEVEAAVGRINGRFGTPSWTPIQYLHRSVDDDVLVALYRAADAMLVTPVRDGMNLVAKEFCAARVDGDGVLILSEFAGAADELTEAMIVNPYDIHGVADAIHTALSMDRVERRQRMWRLRERVSNHDVHMWAEEFLRALDAPA